MKALDFMAEVCALAENGSPSADVKVVFDEYEVDVVGLEYDEETRSLVIITDAQ